MPFGHNTTLHVVLYASILLILLFAVLLVRYYSQFLTDEKKGSKTESILSLKYDDSDEECLETSYLLGNTSFMQQISTGSNTDSDLRVIRLTKDLESSKVRTMPTTRIDEVLCKRKVP
jgi:hypothetical protein